MAGEDADRCRALLGCAASNRLIARVDDAFSALAEAEPLAVARGDDRALAEIHYLRGNLHFARGIWSSAAANTNWRSRPHGVWKPRNGKPEPSAVWRMRSIWIAAWQRRFLTLPIVSIFATHMT